MANKIKKISVGSFEKAVEADCETVVNVEWRGLSVVVKHCLTLKDMLTFATSVAESCFEKETGAYMPEIKDFAVRCCIIEHYTNVSLPENIEKRYDLIYHSDLLDVVMPNIEQDQFNALIEAVDAKIAHSAQAGIEAVSKQINELYASLENMNDRLGAIFDGIDDASLGNLVAALSSGRIDESKIVKAVMDEKKNGGA